MIELNTRAKPAVEKGIFEPGDVQALFQLKVLWEHFQQGKGLQYSYNNQWFKYADYWRLESFENFLKHAKNHQFRVAL